MENIKNLFCDFVDHMSPYSPIEPPDQIAKRLNLPEHKIIKLDANENPYGTADFVMDALSKAKYYHIYPDPAQSQLREKIANYTGCSSKNIVAGTGADELIDLVCRLVIEPGDEVLTFAPTFGYYGHVVDLNRGVLKAFPRNNDFSISLANLDQIDLSRTKMVLLCSPNNPTGNLLEEEVLDYFLSKDLLVVVDEAYYEFSKFSYISKIKKHSNLVILRTFSKCFSLAGLRVGYGIMSEEAAAAISKIKPPYSVNVSAEVALKSCLDNIDYYQRQVDQIIQTREWTISELKKMRQLSVFKTHSNYILCQVNDYDAGKLWKQLEAKGILLRYFATDLLSNYIRISVGTTDQMKKLVTELNKILQ